MGAQEGNKVVKEPSFGKKLRDTASDNEELERIRIIKLCLTSGIVSPKIKLRIGINRE